MQWCICGCELSCWSSFSHDPFDTELSGDALELGGDEEPIDDETKLRDDNELAEDGTELREDKVSLVNGKDSESGRADRVDDRFGVEGSIDMFGCVWRPRRWCSNHMCGASHCKYSDV